MASTKKGTQAEADVFDVHPNWTGPNATFSKYPGYFPVDKVSFAALSSVKNGTTVQVFGPPGSGKSAIAKDTVPKILAEAGFGDVEPVILRAINKGPDDTVMCAPDKDANGKYILIDILDDSLIKPGAKLLVVDDALKASPLLQNQLMQLAAEWRIGGFDLRELGYIGVVFLDNEDSESAQSNFDDMAQRDRYITQILSDQDTSQPAKLHLANKYSTVDLTEAFAARDSLPKELRGIISWRVFDHMVDIMLKGLPGHWALPFINGSYMWLAYTDSQGKTVDRTKEFISKMASALKVPYTETKNDPYGSLIEAALSRETSEGEHWAIRVIGQPGIAKTERARDMVTKKGLDLCVYSLPLTDWDQNVTGVPTSDGRMHMILSDRLANGEAKVVLIDEANRPKDILAFSRSNEIVHDGSLGGLPIAGLQAVIAAENPSEFLGRKMDVMQGDLAHVSRFTATIVIDAADVPFYEWLIKELPGKLAKGNPLVYGGREEDLAAIAEIVCEWHRNDLDNDGRAWISPRNLERMIKAYFNNIPLEDTKIYLGEGQRAPVPLSLLEARLSGRKMTGLRELAAEIDEWEAKLMLASDTSDVGMADVDTVHVAFVNADNDLLWQHAEQVVTLVKYLPARFRVTYFHQEDPDRQKFWMMALGVASGRLTVKDLEKAREARSK